MTFFYFGYFSFLHMPNNLVEQKNRSSSRLIKGDFEILFVYTRPTSNSSLENERERETVSANLVIYFRRG